MTDTTLTHHWRPRAYIRPVVIGLFWRDDRLLVAAVTDDAGKITGWRPLGGAIEFGETAEAALIREMDEELGATLGPSQRRGVIENHFEHQGAKGHEIVFVLDATFIDPGQAAQDSFVLQDQGVRSQAAWKSRATFENGTARLFPDGLAALL